MHETEFPVPSRIDAHFAPDVLDADELCLTILVVGCSIVEVEVKTISSRIDVSTIKRLFMQYLTRFQNLGND